MKEAVACLACLVDRAPLLAAPSRAQDTFQLQPKFTSSLPVEIQAGYSATVKCGAGPIIDIANPFWGATDGTRNSTTIYSYLTSQCLGQQTCVVAADSRYMGDPAPGFAKILRFGVV